MIDRLQNMFLDVGGIHCLRFSLIIKVSAFIIRKNVVLLAPTFFVKPTVIVAHAQNMFALQYGKGWVMFTCDLDQSALEFAKDM